MINHLRYSFETPTRLMVEVPMVAYDRAMKESRLPELLDDETELVLASPEKGGVRLTLSDQWFKENKRTVDDTESTEAAASRWLYALTSTRRFTPDELLDPDLNVQMMQKSTGDGSGQGRLGFHAELTWPLNNNDMAQELAIYGMRKMALMFGYVDKSIIDSVYAGVDENGVLLQALDIGCCCVSTSGMTFEAAEPKAELFGHNLYNRQLMLTCFSGLVALARSRK